MLARAWQFLNGLFLVPALDRRAEQTQHRSFRYFRWYARFALIFYLIAIPLLTAINLANGDSTGLALIPFNIVVFPLMFRLVILMNVRLQGQTMREVSK